MKTQNSLNLDPAAVTVRLGLCAAALAGTAASVPNADADIITFSTPIPIPQTFYGVYLNLLTGATGGTAGGTPGWDFNPYGTTTLGFFWAPAPAGGVASTTTGPYLDLAPGATISAASTFSRTITGTTGSPFLMTGTHILGFAFVNEGTGMTNYGYLTMSNTAAGGFPATILGWSFDNTGAPITIPVPEPSTTALLTVTALALGALGLREWRRQRAA